MRAVIRLKLERISLEEMSEFEDFVDNSQIIDSLVSDLKQAVLNILGDFMSPEDIRIVIDL